VPVELVDKREGVGTMKRHRTGACAVGILVFAAMLAWSVTPGPALASGGGGGGHGGGAWHGGGGHPGGGHPGGGHPGGGHPGGSWHGSGHWHGGSWHGHGSWHGGGVFVGAPLWWPYGYAYPYWYGYPTYSPPVVVESAPTEYVESEPPPQQYWYYCRDPEGYYPDVKECPGGWLPVAPRSASPSE
jgi:hypothetical protein